MYSTSVLSQVVTSNDVLQHCCFCLMLNRVLLITIGDLLIRANKVRPASKSAIAVHYSYSYLNKPAVIARIAIPAVILLARKHQYINT